MLCINCLHDFIGIPRALCISNHERQKKEMKNQEGHAKKTRRHGARPIRRQKDRRPQTAEQYFVQSKQAQDRWSRVTHVISKMRAEGASLREASREFGLDPRMVARLGKPALKKRANGRYTAKPTDNLLRVLVMPSSDGLREIAVRDSRQATLLAEYWVAVQRFLETGDAAALQRIRRKTITNSEGKRVRLIKDLAELERFGSAGVLSFESLYAKIA